MNLSTQEAEQGMILADSMMDSLNNDRSGSVAWGDLPDNFSLTSLPVTHIQYILRPALSQTFLPAMRQSNQLYRGNPEILQVRNRLNSLVICSFM